MRIISGIAGGITLDVPKGQAVRPTSARARKGLFDSIRNFSGLTVVDLFAGAGSLGLEAASRGAARVILVELKNQHISIIRKNVEKVMKAGAECEIKIVRADALSVGAWSAGVDAPDFIFADPPYAESGAIFKSLTSNEKFKSIFVSGAKLIWELPERDEDGSFVEADGWSLTRRRFGGGDFLVAEII